MKKVFLFIAMALIISACSNSNDPEQKSPPTELNTLKIWINYDMSTLSSTLKQLAYLVGITGTDTANIRSVLKPFMETNEFGFDITYISPEGIITMVEPEQYSVVINKDLSQEESYLRMLQTKDVVFSYSFNAWEGIWGATLVCPIYKDGEYLGALSVLIDVNEYLKGLINKLELKSESGLTLWAFENIGTVLIYRKNEEIGKNIFTDEYFDEFPGLRTACESIIGAVSGNTSYEYTNENNQKKKREVWWNTVSIHGTEWKLVSEQE